MEERIGEETADQFTRLTAGEMRQLHTETQGWTKQGEKVYLEMFAHLFETEDRWQIMGFAVDLTEKVETEQRLNQTLKDLADMKYALDQSSIVAITDKQGYITYVNDKFCDISGYSRDELVGNTHKVINSDYHTKEFFKDMWRTIGFGDVWYGEVCNQAKDGSYYWVDTTIVPIKDEKGNPYQYLAIRNNITDKKKNEEKIRYMAYYDHLTDLANRRLFDEYLSSMMERSEKRVEKFGIMFIDLDGFKYINDTLGHLVGDKLLVEVGNRLKEITGNKGFVSRIGGDEFAIFIERIEEIQEMKIYARQVLKGFQKPFFMGDYELNVTGSIGVATYPESGEDAVMMMRHADLAMYRVKGAQKNHYQLYNIEADEETERLFELQNDLRQALESDQFYIVYQPRVNPENLYIQSFEALLRWNHPKYKNVSPGEFIPIAEETGLIKDIGT
ncbi:sensor domain-containing diguanylate cyclase [Salibacterium salarium]|uniref:Sensor domain-containing diguanylate cyclase n=1 Tax=Salibacterium salarium TaxID=284579 RepID=A0A428N6K9_9BACI|nr:sensor domain-containing diguanylate cyclase [Salibacterium salarium]